MSKFNYFILGLFVVSRIFIWSFGPPNFSEIIYSYMPYAHLWASGVQPYLEQLYEYPPVTIALFSIPHQIDIKSLHQFWHLNYSEAYRGLVLIIDVMMFWLAWKTVFKLQKNRQSQYLSLIYYILISAKAHHFIYDSLDWIFAGTILLSAVGPIVITGKTASYWSWLGYWLGVGTKLVNGPLGAVYLFLGQKKLKQTLFWLIFTFVLIWGIPLLVYRSSLQVMLVFHAGRGLQIDSVGAVISRIIDTFTHSEKVIEIYKNYEISGPVSQTILQIVEKLLPLSIVGYLILAWIIVKKSATKKYNLLRVHFTLGYILIFMVVSKVLSTPFLMWHIPLVAIYPFRTFRQQLAWVVSSAFIIITCLSPLPFVDWQFVHLPTWIHGAKALILIGWVGWWFKESFLIDKQNKASVVVK